MNLSEHAGKPVKIKSTGTAGKIVHVIPKRGLHGIAVRFLVEDSAGVKHELMPHEIQIL